MSSFKAVCGQVLPHELSCSNNEARRCWTVPQRLKVTNDPDFEAYAKDHVHINDEDNDGNPDDSGYFFDGSLPSDKKEEVSDSYFFEHLNNKPSGQSSPPIELRKQPPEVNTQSEVLPLFPSMELTQQVAEVTNPCAFGLGVLEYS